MCVRVAELSNGLAGLVAELTSGCCRPFVMWDGRSARMRMRRSAQAARGRPIRTRNKADHTFSALKAPISAGQAKAHSPLVRRCSNISYPTNSFN